MHPTDSHTQFSVCVEHRGASHSAVTLHLSTHWCRMLIARQSRECLERQDISSPSVVFFFNSVFTVTHRSCMPGVSGAISHTMYARSIAPVLGRGGDGESILINIVCGELERWEQECYPLSFHCLPGSTLPNSSQQLCQEMRPEDRS